MKRFMALGAVLAALGVGATALGQKAVAGGATAAQTTGGLSVSPVLIEHTTQPGVLATMTVANRSAATLNVTAAARPWVQSADGKVSPNRRTKLPGVAIDAPAFALAPNQERQIVVSLTSAPSAGALYGAVEVVGVPSDAAQRKGVVLGYRLISRIRVVPSAPKYGLRAGKIKASKGAALLPVKNTGNTVEAIEGAIVVKDGRGTRNSTLESIRILPGATINVPLGSKLQKGAASARVTLRQRGQLMLSVNKKFRVK